jgi:hypothetical protein
VSSRWTWAERVVKKEASVYARVTNIKFPPTVGTELVRVAQGLTPILKKQRGFDGLQVLTDPNVGEGIIRSCLPAAAVATTMNASTVADSRDHLLQGSGRF